MAGVGLLRVAIALAQEERVVGGGIWVANKFVGSTGSLLEWIFGPPLPKLGIDSLFKWSAGDALWQNRLI
jgi:hypothetical protein